MPKHPPYLGVHVVAKPGGVVPHSLLGAGRGKPVPTFSALSPTVLRMLVRRAQELDRTYKPPDFGDWYTLPTPYAERAALDLSIEVKKGTYAAVHLAHYPVSPSPDVAPALGSTTTIPQTHLELAPLGVGARAAWAWPGADGKGVAFCDVERSWDTTHVDLPSLGILYGEAQSAFDEQQHGTRSIGVVAALDNTFPITGVVPGLMHVALSSYVMANGDVLGVQNAILAALAVLHEGDVLLLEVQTTHTVGGTTTNVPIEQDKAVWEAIRLATALRIVVIEPSGNSTLDLDELGPPQPVDGTASDDAPNPENDASTSGALMVGGAVYRGTWALAYNHGARIDCHGQAAYVATLDAGTPTATTTGFNGTSSASAIVAGVACAIQGALSAAGKPRLTPEAMRQAVRTGTSVYNSADVEIGVIPDLVAILTALVGPAPGSGDETAQGDPTGAPTGAPAPEPAARRGRRRP